MNDNFNDLILALQQTVTQIVVKVIQDEANKRFASSSIPKMFYNLKQLEEITGITRLGLKGRIKRGTLKASKDGNTWLVSVKEVERLLNQLEYKKRA